jgi:hypothetical protein
MKNRNILIYVKKTYFISSFYALLIASLSKKFNVYILVDSGDSHFDNNEFEQILNLDFMDILDVNEIKEQFKAKNLSNRELNLCVIEFIKGTRQYDYFVTSKNSEIFTSILSIAMRSEGTKICVVPHTFLWPVESLVFKLSENRNYLSKVIISIRLIAQVIYSSILKLDNIIYRIYFSFKFFNYRTVGSNPRNHLIWVFNNLVSPIDYLNTDVVVTAQETNLIPLKTIYPNIRCQRIKFFTNLPESKQLNKSLLIFVPYFPVVFYQNWMRHYNNVCLELINCNYFDDIFYRFHPRVSTPGRQQVKKYLSFIDTLKDESDLTHKSFTDAIKNISHAIGAGSTTTLLNVKNLKPELITLSFSQKRIYDKDRSADRIRHDVDFIYADDSFRLDSFLHGESQSLLKQQKLLSIEDFLVDL